MRLWQRRWDMSTKGRWTHRLIPVIREWINRRHGEFDHCLTQLLTGHGCFRAYQLRFRLDDASKYPTCTTEVEDAEHVFFACPRYQSERNELGRLFKQQPSPENVVTQMLLCQDMWDAVANFANCIIKKLRLEETIRRGAVA